MKKFNIIIFIYLIFSSNIYSQQGKITYKTYIKAYDKVSNADVKDLISKLSQIANKQEFTLKFNKNYSYFNISSGTMDNNNDLKMVNVARSAHTSLSEVFFDFNNKYIYELRPDGVVTKDSVNNTNWQITKESKLIDKYLCYKAILPISYLSRNGDNISRTITAWFAPSLPFPYGPKTFNGLPGLILELNEKQTTYLISSISLNEKNIIIELPQGKTMTKKAYEDKLAGMNGAIISRRVKKQ